MNYKIAFWVMLFLLTIGGITLGLISYNNISNQESYTNGYNQGVIDTALSQTQTGNVLVVNNQTIETYPISQLCGFEKE